MSPAEFVSSNETVSSGSYPSPFSIGYAGHQQPSPMMFPSMPSSPSTNGHGQMAAASMPQYIHYYTPEPAPASPMALTSSPIMFASAQQMSRSAFHQSVPAIRMDSTSSSQFFQPCQAVGSPSPTQRVHIFSSVPMPAAQSLRRSVLLRQQHQQECGFMAASPNFSISSPGSISSMSSKDPTSRRRRQQRSQSRPRHRCRLPAIPPESTGGTIRIIPT